MSNKTMYRVFTAASLVAMAAFTAGALIALRSWGVHSTASAQIGAYDEEGNRNPFIALVSDEGRLLRLTGSTPEAEKPQGAQVHGARTVTPTVEGIAVDPEGESFAVVNDEIVKVGDVVNDYRIVSIGYDKVVFQKGASSIEVIVHQEEGT